jgi:hypothetical protein
MKRADFLSFAMVWLYQIFYSHIPRSFFRLPLFFFPKCIYTCAAKYGTVTLIQLNEII